MAARLGRQLWHAIVAVVAAALVVSTAVVLIDVAKGDFASTYSVTGAFASAGEGLHAGSEVDERGVQIGDVSSISLVGGKANVVMSIGDEYKLPANVHATIRSQNLFGAEEVVMTVPVQPVGQLRNGATIGRTTIEDQLGSLFAAATPLLDRLDTTDLESVISDLAEASQGEGPAIRRSLDEGTELADLLSRTSTAQLQALDSFAHFTDAIASVGPEVNAISNDANETLPLFDQAANAYHQLLGALSALSDHVTALLVDYRPDIATILASGGNVTRVLISDQSDLENVVTGLYQYAEKFADAMDPAPLPDGSHFGFFKTFVEWNDVQQLICGLLAPDAPGLSFLAPLQQVLSSAATPLDCSKQVSAFDAAQAAQPGGTDPYKLTTATGTTSSAAATRQLSTKINSTGSQLAQKLYQQVAMPQAPTSDSLGGYLQSLVGS